MKVIPASEPLPLLLPHLGMLCLPECPVAPSDFLYKFHFIDGNFPRGLTVLLVKFVYSHRSEYLLSSTYSSYC